MCAISIRRSAVLLAASVLAASSCGTAAAEPALPDLDKFTAVDPAPYQTYGRGTIALMFATPDGLICGFGSARDMHGDPDAPQAAGCTGRFPGPSRTAPPHADGLCASDEVGDEGGLIYYITLGASNGPCDEGPGVIKPLGVGQKIAQGNITCVVAAGEVTACFDTRVRQRHGFILQPSGNLGF